MQHVKRSRRPLWPFYTDLGGVAGSASAVAPGGLLRCAGTPRTAIMRVRAASVPSTCRALAAVITARRVSAIKPKKATTHGDANYQISTAKKVRPRLLFSDAQFVAHFPKRELHERANQIS